ncbi:MAG: AI-2E family transporter [Bacteriovoracaceae bacterium]
MIASKMNRIGRLDKARLFFFLTFIISLLFFMVKVPRISLPLSIAYITSLVLAPFIPKIMKIGVSRNISLIIVFVTTLFVTIYPVIKVVPGMVSEAQKLQHYIPKIETFVRTNYQTVKLTVKERTGFDIGDRFIRESIDYTRQITTSFLIQAPNFLASVVEWILLIPLFLFFLLKDGKGFKGLVLKTAPNFLFEKFYYLSDQFNRKLGDYILAKVIEATIVLSIITIGLAVMDIRFSLILGLIAGVTNVIPYIGPIIGMIPAILLIAAEYGIGPVLGAVVILYVVANAIDIGIVFPILVSKVVDLHPVLVVISVVLGGQYLGVAGMVISIPLAASLKLLIFEIWQGLYASKY